MNLIPCALASSRILLTVDEWQWVNTFIPFLIRAAPFFEITGRESLKWARTCFTIFGLVAKFARQ